ncbi:hypothetical protein CEXT_59851 [Caerostris extrusa]|uniref:Ionotropic glutamate receptor L-glutamate and glycine-binding domain-containing protein n=1 Tax=Caerostris extrusa TaxID=172846 RepID=A0AAV4XUG3_CAEEX|nr:hypothetical protein CEXT_59851 [Caerostris extrusa]
MHLRVAVAEFIPFLKLRKENGNVIMSGALADAFDLIARRVNFTYTLYRAEGDVWGIKRPNGWTGMLGMVSRNEVDIALGPFTLTYGRWSEFKMSAPLYADNIEILTPVFEWRMALFNMITVFKYEVWILLFFTVILICLAMSVTDKCDNPNSKFQTRICKNLWNVTRTLLQKGEGTNNYNYFALNLKN